MRDEEKGVFIGEKIREKYDWCSSFLTQGLNLMTSSQLSVVLNGHVHAALASGSLGIIGVTLSAELLCSGYSVRVEMEFRISDDVGNEFLGILFDGEDVTFPLDTNNSE